LLSKPPIFWSFLTGKCDICPSDSSARGNGKGLLFRCGVAGLDLCGLVSVQDHCWK
jgi:hypothetical protein